MPRAIFLILLHFQALGLLAQDLAALTRLIESERSRLKIPGHTAGVYYKGEILWTRASGIADLKTNRPVQRDTPFRLASISKPMTAVGLLHLLELRKVALEDNLRKHCAAFPAKQHPITLNQLLGHLGGIRHYRTADPTDANNAIRFPNVIEALKKFSNDPLEHEPGTKFLYSTYGFNLVGCAIEGASGMPYEQWMADKVLATVGMCHTAPDNNRGLSLRRAQGYRKTATGEIEDCAFNDNTAKIPGGGYVSNVEDLLRFSEGLFRQRLLKSESIDLMWTPGKLRSGSSTGYGLGWSIAKAPEGDREIYHTGGQQGASTILYLRPDHQFAFVWLTNLEGVDNRLPISRQIFKLATTKPVTPANSER
jgi:serine beta-lactamase-like protein LACTB, mitochondrial